MRTLRGYDLTHRSQTLFATARGYNTLHTQEAKYAYAGTKSVYDAKRLLFLDQSGCWRAYAQSTEQCTHPGMQARRLEERIETVSFDIQNWCWETCKKQNKHSYARSLSLSHAARKGQHSHKEYADMLSLRLCPQRQRAFAIMSNLLSVAAAKSIKQIICVPSTSHEWFDIIGWLTL